MRKAILILLLLIAPNLFSQNKEQEYELVSHQVLMGETVRTISKKYLVPPTEIYKLNKFAIDGISQGMVLRIPVPVKEAPVAEPSASPEAPVETVTQTPVDDYQNQSTEHRVQSGETLSGLAQQYGVTVKAIKAANPKVSKRGLRTDDLIVIPPVEPSDEFVNEVMGGEKTSPGQAPQSVSSESFIPETPATVTSEMLSHKVRSGETLSVLAEKYGVTIKAIKDANPKVGKRGLRADETIKIPSIQVKSTPETQSGDNSTQAAPSGQAGAGTTGALGENAAESDIVIEHQVQPGETLFGLSRKYNVPVDVIKKQNAKALAQGLKVGQLIKIKPE